MSSNGDKALISQASYYHFNMNFKRDTITDFIAKICPHFQYWVFGVKKKNIVVYRLKPTGEKSLVTPHLLLFGAP